MARERRYDAAMSRILRLVAYLVATLALIYWLSGRPPTPSEATVAANPAPPTATTGEPGAPAFLPPEAIDTLRLIERGGPFPYPRDGVTFQNREHRLPERPRGYYREYTVPTPGSPDRGARRIIAGGDPPEVYYYTGDHYRSFRPAEPPR